MLNPPYPEFDEILESIGQASFHLAEIKVSEGLSADEIRTICRTFNVQQNIY